MKNIIQQRKKTFKVFVDSLFINDELKSYISDDRFIDKNQLEYLIYPEIFFPAFCENPESFSKEIEMLNNAGYLYYRSIIEIDSTLDNIALPKGKQPEKHFLPIISSICQEESIKLLTALFQLNPVFWKVWNKRRSEYLHAVIMDKKKPESISLSEFEVLADYKSAFGKVAIDASFILSGSDKTTTYKSILESHKLFSIGFQLIDDILDFKKDMINPQINFAHISLRNYLKNAGIDYDKNNYDTLNKYLYIYGIAEELITLAKDYFNRSFIIIESLNIDIWKHFIQKNIYKSNSMLIQLITYNKQIDSKIKLSKTLSNKREFPDVIDEAKRFLISNQAKEGFWEDFVNNAGVSNIWATGYVLSNISDLTTGFDKDCIDRACKFLINNKQGSAWGYNTNWIEDIDSTTLVLLALSLNGYDVRTEHKLWLAFQKENGAFSTYRNTAQLSKSLNHEFSDLRGWTHDHICVSSMAYFYLCKTNSTVNEQALLKELLLSSLNHNGLLEAYWWTSPIYPTSYFLQADLMKADKSINKDLKMILLSLLKLQNKDGSFSDNFSETSCFYTALALSALCSSAAVYRLFKPEADIAASWIIQHQFSDGSFESSYSLQIPLPNVIDSKTISKWSKLNQFSTNVLTQDFMRLFTTSAVLKALDSYINLGGGK